MLRLLGLVPMLLFIGSCGEDVEPQGRGFADVVHLLEVDPQVLDWPETVLPPDLQGLLKKELVMVRGEVQDRKSWAKVLGTAVPEGFLHLRAPYDMPFRGEPSIYSRDQANDPKSGRRPPEGVGYIPGPDEFMLGAEGVEVVQPIDDPWPPRIRYSYLTSSQAILDALCGGLPEADSEPAPFETPLVARRVRHAPASSKLAWSVRIPPAGSLRLGYGLRELAYRVLGGGLEMRSPSGGEEEGSSELTFIVTVSLAGESARQEVWRQTLLTDQAGHIHDAVIDLAAWAGQDVHLLLEVASEHPVERGLPFWAEPVLDGERPTDAGRPNIIVLLLDTLRADRLGCYGGDRRGLTPNLDGLARRGVHFEDTMSAGPCTLPSHASLFASVYPSEHGVYYRERLSDDFHTVAEVLREGGYQTHAQTEGIFVHHEFGLAQGFDTFTIDSNGIQTTYNAAMERVRGIEGPFFLFLHSYETHIPYTPPPNHRQRWVRPYDGPFTHAEGGADLTAGPDEIVPADVQYLRDLYDAEIAYADSWVGNWLRFMQEEDLMANSLLVVTSDHGDEFLDHGGFNHGHTLYQEQLRVPLILYQAGGFEGGIEVEHTVHGVDLAPTLVAAAGIDAPPSWQGVALSVTPPETDRPLFTPFRTLVEGQRAAAWRVGSMKLITYPKESGDFDPLVETQLYNLRSDPGEQVDLWEKEVGGGRAAKWLERLDDQFFRYPQRSGAEKVKATHEADIQAMGYAGDD